MRVMFWKSGMDRKGPVNLPTRAVKNLVTGEMISNLEGVDWSTRNQCGFWEILFAVAPVGEVITAKHWPDTPSGGIFAEVIDSTVTQEEWDLAQEAAELAYHDADAPAQGLESWEKKDRFFLRLTYKLAKQIIPALTLEQFLNAAKDEWDLAR